MRKLSERKITDAIQSEHSLLGSELKTGYVDEPFLTTKEIARELVVTDRTIQNLVSRGIIRKIQIGRCVRFLKSEVLSDLQNQK